MKIYCVYNFKLKKRYELLFQPNTSWKKSTRCFRGTFNPRTRNRSLFARRLYKSPRYEQL